MPFQPRLTGSFGAFGLMGGDARRMVINLETATQIFRKVFIEKGSPFSDTLGIFSYLDVGPDGKAKLIEIGTPRHVLQSRKNCRTWTPKGNVNLTPGEIGTAPIEYMGTQCSDSFIGTCFEKILPLGANVWDFTATPEGRQMFGAMLNSLYTALGNSIHNVVMYANSTLITDADTNGYFDADKITAEEWEDFMDQQTGIGMKGLYTLIDEAKADSVSGFTVDISSYYTGTGAWDDTKDPRDLFDAVLGEATGELNVALERERGRFDAAILVDGATFRAYRDELISLYTSIPESYRLLVDGEPQRGILMYDGIPVIAEDSIGMMNAYLGSTTRRCIVTTLGNMSIARQQSALPSEYDGAGLIVEQSSLLRDKGRTDMYAAFRLGTAIADTDFMCSGEHTVTP